MIRIRDVADLAGVSTATVSRVLNGKPVREELAKAVREAADQLGYVPHATARSLRRGHSDLIALVVPDVENPFFTTIARAVEDEAANAGYSVVLCNTDDAAAKEEKYLNIALRENMAGVIIAPATYDPALGPLLERKRAVVVIDRETRHDVDHITFDNVALGRDATRVLLERGHTRILCVTGPKTTSTAVQRAQGWREALMDAGCAPSTEMLAHVDFRVEGGREATEFYIRSGSLDGSGSTSSAAMPGATAILATNNLVGVGALQALSANEYAMDVSVIGDLPYATSDLRDVSVTSLTPSKLGREAITRLLARIENPSAPVESAELKLLE